MDPLDEDFEELDVDAEGDDSFDDEEGGELAEEHVAEEEVEDEGAAPPVCSGPDTSLRAFRGHSDSVYAVDVSPDGKWAVSGSGDDTAALWRLSDCALQATLRASADTVSCVAFSASGRLVAVGSFDTLVRVYSLASLVVEEGPTGGGGSGGGGGGGGGGESGGAAPAPLHLLEGPAEGIECVAWHPKGDVLLAGSSDGTVWMWSAGERGAAACMQVFVGHASGVSACAFTRDGRLVLSASEDGSVRVWSPKSAACVKVFDLGEAPVTALSTSPLDGNLVCASAMDGAARLLHVEGKRVVHTVSHQDGRGAAAGGGGGGGGGRGEGAEEEASTSVEW
jgi:WD40 repeat protein